MDLNAIAAAIASKLADLGYQSFDHVPEDVNAFPASVVGDLDDYEIGASMRRTLVVFAVTLAFSFADQADAMRRLRAALSTNDADTSVVIALHEPDPPEVEDDGEAVPVWTSIRVKGLRGGLRLVTSGSTTALAVDLAVEVIA